MKIFFDSSEKRYDGEFLTWTENNPEGFVVTLRGNDRPMLHHENCPHLVWKSKPAYSMTKKMKACSRDRHELENWVMRGLGKTLEYCSDCQL